MLLHDVTLPLLGHLPSVCLQRLASTCSFCSLAVRSCETVWRQRIVDDFGGSADCLSKLRDKHGDCCVAHRRLRESRKAFDEAVVVVTGDLCRIPTQFDIDAIICPAVPTCEPYGPCASAVHDAAGFELLEHLETTALPRVRGQLDVGQALITPAFKLKDAKAIVHAVGPTWQHERKYQVSLLRRAYESAVAALEAWPHEELRRVASASISTGGNGVAPVLAAPLAMTVFRDAVQCGSIDKIFMVVCESYTRHTFEAAKRMVLDRYNEDPPLPSDVRMPDW